MKQPDYWFPAKRFGWGWGPPRTWQGWVVMVIMIAAQIALAIRYLPWRPLPFAVGTALVVGLFMLVCWITGEPPRWRWGDRDP